ncbi:MULTISPECIES: IpaD/SipD/SspD family type III secretion system needle tip protein [Burkholderia]|uniref:IpaD/SipD/SspD family type III secretion system needle tip protein n=1 Tax=Burkholderia TaxID=32008 RepID=UPI00075D11CB|nr:MULTISPECIES: IpaD/SipD/SspD family type III secretion system needle tip protein [Burkholderia]AOJ73532.1 hypothetical protein WS78_32360 [Burkholderia savannae]KVG38925.1 hypothetical protein WS77_20445 [Burkholderia sp. MSMB0265]KVG81651.1 hypothetical protein WS81_02195 [Burkholderia sp. MSMB2040]KVG98808.1 hypothetical protein WS83_27760 [Burkholderia sp. MSMB2042]KVG98989.1 hypothetical protein WS82_25645 [Burkholderia sp. MSMB2041]
MSISVDMGRVMDARNRQALARTGDVAVRDAGVRDVTDDVRTTDVHCHVTFNLIRKFRAMSDEALAIRYPKLIAGKFIEGSRANLAVFDDARVAVRAYACGLHNLLERSEAENPGCVRNEYSDIQPDPILQGLIDVINQGKIDVDAETDILEKLVTSFKEVTDAMSKIQDYISAKNDKTMTVKCKEIRALLQKVIDNLPSYQLPPGEDLDRWREELGGAFSISDDGVVTIKPDELISMRDSLPDKDSVDWDTARESAWYTGFQAEESNIQNDVQTFAEKNQHQISSFDNLNKVLSGAISALMDVASSFLKNAT